MSTKQIIPANEKALASFQQKVEGLKLETSSEEYQKLALLQAKQVAERRFLAKKNIRELEIEDQLYRYKTLAVERVYIDRDISKLKAKLAALDSESEASE